MAEYRGNNPSQGRGGQETCPVKIPSQEIINDILKGNVEELVKWAESLGTGLAKARLTTAQVRSFFGEIRQIEAMTHRNLDRKAPLDDDVHRRLMLLKPKLQYQARRERDANKGDGVTCLAKVLDPAITNIGRNRERFQCLVDFFEAILAYHKAAGGKDR